MAQRARYWSSSKLAECIRGTTKPRAATMEEWDEWSNVAEKSHPIRYWIAETALNKIQNALWYPIDKLYGVKYWVINRYITRTHALTSTLARGQWYDYDTRILNCLFSELVNFVEIETAASAIAWLSKENRAKYNPPFWAVGWFKWRTWRSPRAGLDSLKWQAALKCTEECGVSPENVDYGKPTSQAISAQEIISLYTWWTVTRPARPDPYEASGWNALYKDEDGVRKPRKKFRSWGANIDKDAKRAALDRLSEIEAEYEKEDDDNLIRLIKARKAMWT